MDELKEKYEKLKEEFETYQNFAESNIQILNEKNQKLEKNLDALTNIVEISKYINSYLSDDNLIPMINDMIIGILGVTYSSIFIREGCSLTVKATNKQSPGTYDIFEGIFDDLENGKPCILNCKSPINAADNETEEIHSLIGVPVYLRENSLGYIIVEHSHYNFFGYDHIKFMTSAANQIGIALENNFLYNKVKESSIRDPLLGIYNRKYFFDSLEEIVKGHPKKNFAIVMADMDNFKKANDLNGHQFGDEVLIRTIQIINEGLNKDDIVARYGGEEIALCIKNVDSHRAVYDKINTIREKISKNSILYGGSEKFVTASFGISYYPDDGQTIAEVVMIADAMLYAAKNSGRNRVVASRV